MQVHCQLTPADVQAVQEAIHRPAWGARHWGRHEWLRRVLAGAALAVLVVVLLKLFARNKLGADIIGWDAVLGVMLGGVGMGIWWARQNTTIPPENSPAYLPFTLSLNADGFRVNGEGFDNFTGWDQVTSLRDAGGCLAIETRLGAHHLVPRSSFASAEAANAFLAQAQAWHEVAKPPAAQADTSSSDRKS